MKMDCFKKEECRLWAIVIVLVTIVSLDLYHFYWFSTNDDSIVNLYSGCLIILTTLLVGVAYINLKKISKTSQSDFLLRVDDRYGSELIVRARTLIHQLQCQARSFNGLCKDANNRYVSDKIIEMQSKEDSAEKYICLLNFLDFLETISYFTNKGLISIEDTKELMGGFLIDYYDVFKAWIDVYRKANKDSSYFTELETVIKKLRLPVKTL